jgi:trk system potassium uptake protein TrkA
MKIIIMGCDRVGSQVSRLLANAGHDVVVIDADVAALAALGPTFKGRTVQGVGFDRKVMVQAGIEHADAFAATSPSDNANIVAARAARMMFHVPRVVAALNDPRRAEIYRRLGLVTISMTAWGAERISELLTHTDLDSVTTFGRGEVSLVSVEISGQLAGRMVKELSIPGEIMVIAICRDGEAFVPVFGTEFRNGDVAYLSVMASSIDRLESLLD